MATQTQRTEIGLRGMDKETAGLFWLAISRTMKKHGIGSLEARDGRIVAFGFSRPATSVDRVDDDGTYYEMGFANRV